MRKAYLFYLALFIIASVSVFSFIGHNRDIIYGDFVVITDDGSRIYNTPLYIPPTIPEETVLEFQTRTDQWFGITGLFSYSAGYLRPGSEISFQRAPWADSRAGEEINEYLQIHFTLTQRDRDWQYVATIKEQTFSLHKFLNGDLIFQARVSEEEDVPYLLSVEIIGETGVEDTLLAEVYVPLQQVNATLTLDQQQYSPKNTLTLTILNHGPTVIGIFRDFKIERAYHGSWVNYPLQTILQQYPVNLNPGWSYKQSVPLRSFTEGEYRIIKTIMGPGTDIQEDLVGTFKVK